MEGQNSLMLNKFVRVSKTSTVNIDHSRFAVDGVIAEMIIEVDDNEESSVETSNKVLLLGESHVSAKEDCLIWNGTERMEPIDSLKGNEEPMDSSKSAEPMDFPKDSMEPIDSSKKSFAHTLGLSSVSCERYKKVSVPLIQLANCFVLNNTVDKESTVPSEISPLFETSVTKCDAKKVAKKPNKSKVVWNYTKRRRRGPRGSAVAKQTVRDQNVTRLKRAYTKRNAKMFSAENKQSSQSPVNESGETPNRISLRKLPFRLYLKEPSAAVEVKKEEKEEKQDHCINGLKPGRGVKLGNIAKISDGIKSATKHGLKPLFRVIYYQWPSFDMKKTIHQMLQFNGFPFDSSSQEYENRKKLLKRFTDHSLQFMCNLFDIKLGARSEIVDNILKFLSEPKLNPLIDRSMQPVVRLLKIDVEAEKEKLRKKSSEAIESSKKKRAPVSLESQAPPPSKKIKEISKDVTDVVEKKKRPGKVRRYTRRQDTGNSKKDVEHHDPIKVPPRKRNSSVQRRSPDKRRRPDHYGDWIRDDTTMSLLDEEEDIPDVVNHEAKNAKVVIGREVAPKVTEETSETDSDHEVEKHSSSRSKCSSLVEEEEASGEEDEASGEEEEASGEEEEASVEEEDKQKEVVPKGIKLFNFLQIRRNINAAEKSVLQRLHVILYGTSDQPENMKKNILNFYGFGFERNSADWNSKYFTISLLSTNIVREYIDVLCIHLPDDSNPKTMINTLMNFLMAPRSELLDKRSFVLKKPVEKPQSAAEKSSFVKPQPKVQKPKKKERAKPKTRGKVLMDEATVRKMELELAREQRAKRRASLNETSFLAPHVKQPGVPPKTQVRSSFSGPLSSTSKQKSDLLPGQENVKVMLSENAHVKFMIVALDYPDLEIIHNLIFLHGAVKSKIRRNILDFHGFVFDKYSRKYQVRRTILERLGYNIVKRIAFIMGLAPLKTQLPMKELCDLIMNFLMSPSKIKQVPIREFPPKFFQSYPRDFNKKEVFKSVPYLDQVLADDFALPTLTVPVLYKNVNDVSKPGTPKEVMETPDTGIPIAEVITSDMVKINGISGAAHGEVPSTKSLTAVPSLSAKKVMLADAVRAKQVNKSPNVPKEKLNPVSPFVVPKTQVVNQWPSPVVAPMLPTVITNKPHVNPPQSQSSSSSGVSAPLSTTQATSTHLAAPLWIAPTQIQPSPMTKFYLVNTTQALGMNPSASFVMSSAQQQQPLATSKFLVLTPPQQPKPQQQAVPSVSPQSASASQSQSSAPEPNNPLISKLRANARALVKNNLIGQPRAKSADKTASTSQTQVQTLDFAKRVLTMPQLQVPFLKPSQGQAQEVVVCQKNTTGEEQKLTFIRLSEGHPLVPSLESGSLNCPLKISPVPSVRGGSSTPVKMVLQQVGNPGTSSDNRNDLPCTITGNLIPQQKLQEPEEIVIDDDEEEDEEEDEIEEYPCDGDLFAKIRDIIHDADLEDLTLKKVTEKLLVEYPNLDVVSRRDFIKSSVKNIVCGMTLPSSS